MNAGFHDFQWKGCGRDEANHGAASRRLLVKIDPAFYRPADVAALCGDSTLARTELQWRPKVGFRDLVRQMVWRDIGHHAPAPLPMLSVKGRSRTTGWAAPTTNALH